MKNTIIRTIIFMLLFTLNHSNINAQVSMYFCSSQPEQRLYTGCADIFCKSAYKGRLNVILMAQPGNTLNVCNILYLIYRDTVCTAKVYEHNLQPGWTYFSKSMDIFVPGNYTIEVYDVDDYLYSDKAYGTLMCTGYITIDDKCTVPVSSK